MSRLRLSKPKSDSTLYPVGCTSAKAIVSMGVFKSILLVCNMSRSCQNKPNSFSYICGEVELKSQRKPLPQLVRKAYELYFGCKVGDQDEV
jgi:hypothetical protein